MLEQMLAENAWASFHIWERTQRGNFSQGDFRIVVWSAFVRPAQNGARRRLVAQRQR